MLTYLCINKTCSFTNKKITQCKTATCWWHCAIVVDSNNKWKPQNITEMWYSSLDRAAKHSSQIMLLAGNSIISLLDRYAQILDTSSPGLLNSVWWQLIFVSPHFGTCFISPFWHLEFWAGFQVLGDLWTVALKHFCARWSACVCFLV
jgi:hypothetical protein